MTAREIRMVAGALDPRLHGAAPAAHDWGMDAPADSAAPNYWHAVVQQKWKILLLALAVGICAFLVTLTFKPVYRSTAAVLVEPKRAKVLSNDELSAGGDAQQQPAFYQTQVELLQSRDLAERTIRALRLWEQPAFAARPEVAWWAQWREWFELGPGDTKPLQLDESQQVSRLVGEFASALTAKQVGVSHLISISFDSTDAALAAKVANQHAAEYIDADREARLNATRQVGEFLQARLSELRNKVAQSEQALQTYRESKGLLSLSGSVQVVAGKQVESTGDTLVVARSRRAELESAYRQVMQGGDISDIAAVVRYPGVADAQRQVSEARRRLADLSQTLGSNHIRIQQAEADLAQLTNTLRQERAAAVASIKRDYESARTTVASLERELASVRRDVRDVNREEFQLRELERDVATNTRLYDLFLSRSKETDLASEVQAPIGRVADRAVVAAFPVKPAKVRTAVLAMLLTLVLGAGLAVLQAHFDSSLNDAEDAENRLGLPVLAAIPRVDLKDLDRTSRLALVAPHSPLAEAIRTARTGVLLSTLDTPRKVILVTSALPDEGKTTFACNLALSLSQTHRTLLIDADMRRAQVAPRLGLPPSAAGLTDLLAGTAVQDTLRIVKDSALLVMPVGSSIPPNPLDLLLSQRFRSALSALSEQFEIIVIDSPPVEPVSDALVLAPLATSTLVVVKSKATPVQLVQRTVSRLQRAGASSMLAVLNSVKMLKGGRYAGDDLPQSNYVDSRLA